MTFSIFAQIDTSLLSSLHPSDISISDVEINTLRCCGGEARDVLTGMFRVGALQSVLQV